MRRNGRGLVPWMLALVAMGLGTRTWAQESPQLRPEVDLLKQSVSEKLQSAADALGLTQEQRDKIKETSRSFESKRQALRDQREELLRNDLKAIGEILTPEQREKCREIIEDRMERPAASEGPVAWPRDSSMRETLAQKLRVAPEELGLTPDQRRQIRERLASSAEKYREQRRARRELIASEYREIAGVLNTDQREKCRRFFERRVLTAPHAQSVTERLHAAAEGLGLTPEQRKKIGETYQSFEPKFEALADDRRELLQSELKAVGDALTPEQREKVGHFLEDRMVVVDVTVDPSDPQTLAQLKQTIAERLKESIAERLEAAADRLDLTQEQRDKIKAAHTAFVEKYAAQRIRREALRKEELQAMDEILTPEQREKVKTFVADTTPRP